MPTHSPSASDGEMPVSKMAEVAAVRHIGRGGIRKEKKMPLEACDRKGKNGIKILDK